MMISYTIPKHSPQRLETESDRIVIGRRPLADQSIDLDLELDDYVSRMHSCISAEAGGYWVEDLESANGTWVNGSRIDEKTRLKPGDTIQIGYTIVVVQMETPGVVRDETTEIPGPDATPDDELEKTVFTERGEDSLSTTQPGSAMDMMEHTTINPDFQSDSPVPEASASEEATVHPPPAGVDADAHDATLINPDFAGLGSEPDEPAHDGEIVDAVDLTIHTLIGSGRDTVDEMLMQSWRQLKAFNELVGTLCTAEKMDALVEILVNHLQEAIPNALRGAVLLPDESGELLLKAHWPPGDHSVSMTWVRRAFENRESFIWAAPAEDDSGSDLPKSAIFYKVQAAIYVPLIVGQDVLGVMYIDNYYDREAFSATDLELVKAVANQVALFVRDRVVKEDRHTEKQLLSRLSRQFSPKIFDLMMKKSSVHRIGGEKIDPVTILVSDVRGFTALSRGMDPGDVVRMLNEMFDAFVPIIFEYDGIVDKYVGDSVLAVFGSPESDGSQWEKAVRSALEMQRAVKMLGEGRRVRRLPVFDVGIGIHTGPVIHGFIGSAERTEYTVIGDTVNRASRYCDGAGAGEIFISKSVYEHVYRLVQVHPKTIPTKHADLEPDMEGYIVKTLKTD